MFSITVLTAVFCLAIVHVQVTSVAGCWASSACIDKGACGNKGGSAQTGLCPGAANIQCCSW
jgi:hypothetical protein